MTKKRAQKLTLPVSDTLPGPGTFEVGILMDDFFPSVETEETPDYIGNGTADDVSSTLQAPEPEEAYE